MMNSKNICKLTNQRNTWIYSLLNSLVVSHYCMKLFVCPILYYIPRVTVEYVHVDQPLPILLLVNPDNSTQKGN